MKQVAQLGFGRSFWLVFATIGVFLTFGTTLVLAAADAPAATATEKDPETNAILMKMAKVIAKAPAFRVNLRSGYDAIQEDGQYIEFGEKRLLLLQRPERMRVETERSDGERSLLLFDGKEFTAFKADDNVYTRVEKPGTVDDALVYLVRDLQFTLPMALMLHTDFAQRMEKRITAISYVEESYLFDVVTDHLAARTADVDMQLWIAQGEQPLPRRIVVTYKNAPGQPQYRADFLEWNLSPKIAADSFTFTPPAGAEQIPLLAPVRQKGSLPVPKGDK